MILYHFTDLFNLHNAGPDAILSAGLKAHDPSLNTEAPGGSTGSGATASGNWPRP